MIESDLAGSRNSRIFILQLFVHIFIHWLTLNSAWYHNSHSFLDPSNLFPSPISFDSISSLLKRNKRKKFFGRELSDCFSRTLVITFGVALVSSRLFLPSLTLLLSPDLSLSLTDERLCWMERVTRPFWAPFSKLACALWEEGVSKQILDTGGYSHFSDPLDSPCSLAYSTWLESVESGEIRDDLGTKGLKGSVKGGRNCFRIICVDKVGSFRAHAKLVLRSTVLCYEPKIMLIF